MRLFLFFFFCVTIGQVAEAQKIQKAINALRESKHQKALELFAELIEKDSRDIAAIIGQGKTYKACIEANTIIPAEPDLKIIISQLKSGAALYDMLSTDDKIFIHTNFALSNYEGVRSLVAELSGQLWLKYVSLSNNIDSVQEYLSKYAIIEDQKFVANEYLSELNFRKIENSENIKSFSIYLNNFPKTKYKDQILKKIEAQEFNEIAFSNNVELFEKYLIQYPLSQLKDSILNSLARLYFTSVAKNKSSKNNVYDALEKLERIQSSYLARQYIDSCNKFIFTIDKKDAITNGELNALNTFLGKYNDNKNYYLEDVLTIRNSKWKQVLETEQDLNLSDVNKFIRATSLSLESIEHIISNVNKSITKKIKTAVNEYVTNYFSKKLQLGDEEKSLKIISLFKNQLAIQISISNKKIYDFLKSANKADQDEILEEFVSKIGFDQIISINPLYFKTFGDYDEFIEVMTLSTTGGLIKKTYEFNGTNLIEITTPKTSFPIFNAIKQRYSITAFTAPIIKRLGENGYVVSLYGVVKGDAVCCPSYAIEMLYKKINNVLIPVTALTIDHSYQSVSEYENLNEYHKIDNQTLINAKRLLIVRKVDNNEAVGSGFKDNSQDIIDQGLINENITDDKVYAVVQIPAEFPGGLPAWTKYLERNLNRDLPVENGAPPGKYIVNVSFIVDKNGGISEVKAENDPGYGTKDEAVRVIKRGPNWKPAVQNGRNVKYLHRLWISFIVSDMRSAH